LTCKPEDGKWGLSDESLIEAIPHLHKGQALTHLCWSPSGSELAVVDVCGRVSVLTMSMALNNFLVLRSPSKDSEDDLNAPVGMFWLNFDRNVRTSL
jgi:mediator of RNA polymerase II transcription subunit 16, fungi type